MSRIKWKYLILSREVLGRNRYSSIKEIIDGLNEMDNLGWELVSVVDSDIGQEDFYFKKERIK